MQEEQLLEEYVNRDGDTVIIQEMDDYYLRNAFNYALRRLRAVKDFVCWMSEQMGNMLDEEEIAWFCEKHKWAHHLQVLESLPRWIQALGKEAESRGVMSTCTNCEGKGEYDVSNGKKSPCLICCGTGWVMRGVKVKEE